MNRQYLENAVIALSLQVSAVGLSLTAES